MRRAAPRAVWLLASMASLAGCGGGGDAAAPPTSPPPPPVRTATALSGRFPALVLCDSLPLASLLGIQLVDSVGSAVAQGGVTVTASIVSGPPGAVLLGASAQTASNGLAQFPAFGIRGPSGEYVVRFTAGSLPAYQPPDTLLLLPAKFLVLTQAGGNVVRVRADGSGSTTIAGVSTPNLGLARPHFSPDGQTIAFAASGGGPGVNAQWLTFWTAAGGLRRYTTRDSTLDVEAAPRWSPDGQWLYYATLPAGTAVVVEYRMRPDGTGRTPMPLLATSVDPHPDGRRVASYDPTGATAQIVDLVNSTTRPVSPPTTMPRWSPDGTRLAGIDPSGNMLRLYDTLGVVVDSLPAPAPPIFLGSTTMLAWSPDGQYLITRLNTGTAVVRVSTKRWRGLPVGLTASDVDWQR